MSSGEIDRCPYRFCHADLLFPTRNICLAKSLVVIFPRFLASKYYFIPPLRFGQIQYNDVLKQIVFEWITIIIIMSCHRHGYPWSSLAISPYSSSPLASLQGYIPYPHIAAVCKFELVVLLSPGHMWGSIGVHHLWARPCSSSSVLHVWFV